MASHVFEHTGPENTAQERGTNKSWKIAFSSSYFPSPAHMDTPDIRMKHLKHTQCDRSLTACGPGIHTIRLYRWVWQGHTVIT